MITIAVVVKVSKAVNWPKAATATRLSSPYQYDPDRQKAINALERVTG